MNRRVFKKRSKIDGMNEGRRGFGGFRLDLNLMENVWMEQRLKMLDNSLELVENDENHDEEEEEESGCARCRIYQRKETHQSEITRQIHQFHREHNYSLHQHPSSSSPGLFILFFTLESSFSFRIRFNSFIIKIR